MNVKPSTVLIGDNLPMMRGIDSGTIDLIATDPPYGHKRKFMPTPIKEGRGRNWHEITHTSTEASEAALDLRSHHDQRLAWLTEMTRLTKGDQSWAYISYMAIRALEMHRILRPTGALFWQIDSVHSHYLKMMLDIIFGSDNCKGEIIWERTKGRATKHQFGRCHDTLYHYVKSQDWVFNPQYLEPNAPTDRNRKEVIGEELKTTQCLTAEGTRTGESGIIWKGIDPADVGRHWAPPTQGQVSAFIRTRFIPDWPVAYPTVKERLDALDKAGLVHWSKNGNPRLKKYSGSTKGPAVTDVWTDIPHMSYNSSQNQSFTDQKPLPLYERIIRATTKEGDWVLDPFGGCGTTMRAAEALGRNWVGIDSCKIVGKTTQRRMPDGASVRVIRSVPQRTDEGNWAITSTYPMDESSKPLPNIERKKLRRIMNPMNKDRLKCEGCDQIFTDTTFGHLIPESQGGALHHENMVWLCKACNGRMSDKFSLTGLRNENRRLGILKSHNQDPAPDLQDALVV